MTELGSKFDKKQVVITFHDEKGANSFMEKCFKIRSLDNGQETRIDFVLNLLADISFAPSVERK